MPPQQGRKAEPEASWESHKNTIQRLYIAEKRTLKTVMDIMADLYDFHASKFQYERHFELWGLRKKRKNQDWVAIGHQVFKRKRSNKDSAVYIDDVLVTPQKVRKEIGRNCSSLVRISQAPSPRIPDGVMVCTPASASSPQTLQDVLVCTPTPLLEISNLPYFQFEEFLMTYSMYKDHEWATSNSNTVRLRLKPDSRDLGPQGNFQLQSHLLEDIQLGVMKQISQESYKAVSKEMQAVVSSLRCIVPDVFVESSSTSSTLTGEKQNKAVLNLLRTMFFSLSNNLLHSDIDLRKEIVAWLQSTGVMGFLDSLMSARGPAFESLAEKLFGIAIETENIPLLQAVLKTGLNPNEKICDSDGWCRSALQKASGLCNVNLVRSLIEGGADVNNTPHATLDEHKTPLDIAVGHGNTELVCLLLQNGADVNYFCDGAEWEDERNNMPALHRAVIRGDTALVNILLDAGADANSEDWVGRTPLECVFGADWVEDWVEDLEADGSVPDEELVMGRELIMKMLLQAGASPNAIVLDDNEDYPDEETVMAKAILTGSIELVQLLLDFGANMGKNAAYFAVKCGNTQLVRILLGAGADPNYTFSDGACPLSAAVEEDNIELVTLLLDAGAEADGNPEKISFLKSESTPLQAACQNRKLDLVMILLEAGADVNAPPSREKYLDGFGKRVERSATALEAASTSGNVELVRTLLQFGAQVTHRSLLRAVESENIDLVKMLIGEGADVNFLPCPPEATLLQAAVSGGIHAIVQCLLDAGADVNATAWPRTSRGFPVKKSLITAIQNRDLEFWRFQNMRRADVNIVGGIGFGYGGMWTKATPLAVAAARGDFQLFELLLRYGANPDDPQALSAAVGTTCGVRLAQLVLDAHLRINGNVRGIYGCEALQLAILLKDFNMIDILIQAGVDINALNPLSHRKNITPLKYLKTALGIWLAEIRGARMPEGPHLLVARQLVSEGRHLNNFLNNPFPQTALQMAIETKSMAATQILIDAGADANARGVTGLYRTALQAAVDWGDEQLIQSLLTRGADVNAPATGRIKRTALQTAAEKGNLALVKILMKAGADVNAPPAPDGGITALQTAAKEGNLALVEILIKAGADVNAPPAPNGGITAFQTAAEKENLALIEILIKAGADVNTTATNGQQQRTALQRAAENENLALVKILIKAGADLNAPVTNEWQRTALQMAAENGNLALVEILMKAGADVNAPAANGWRQRTALQTAAERGNLALVEILIKAGADVNAPATNGWRQRTALQTAAEIGNLALVEILMKAGADVNVPPAPERGITALQGCAIGGYIDIASLLISKGADVNAKGARSYGRTAVEGAAEHGRIDMLQMLLNAGVELEGPGKKEYDSALELASENGHNAARRLLESHHTRRAAKSDPEMAIPPQIPTPMSTSRPGDRDSNGAGPLTESGVGCLNLPSLGLSNMHDFGWPDFADQELPTPEGFMSGWGLPWEAGDNGL